MSENIEDFKDDLNLVHETRICNLVIFLVRQKTGLPCKIIESLPFHYSQSGSKYKSRSIVASIDFCYCIEAIFDYNTEKLMSCNLIFALRRGNKDFEIELETKGKRTLIVPKVGPLRIDEFKPIITQLGDEYTGTELGRKLVQMVKHGRRIKKNPITDQALTTEEDIYVDLIIKIRRFVSNFHRHIMNFMSENDKLTKAQKMETYLHSDYGRKKGQLEFSLSELIEIINNERFSEVITDKQKLRFFAYQKPVLMRDLTNISKIQEKLVHSHMPVSEQIRDECFNCIRRVTAKMMRFDDDFNQILEELS